jgi:hypothetical protein
MSVECKNILVSSNKHWTYWCDTGKRTKLLEKSEMLSCERRQDAEKKGMVPTVGC